MLEVKTNTIQLRMDDNNLKFSFGKGDTEWNWTSEYRPKMECKEGTVYFDEALEIHHELVQNGIGKGIRSSFAGFEIEGKKVPYAFETYAWIEECTEDIFFEWIPICEEGLAVEKLFWPGELELEEKRKDWYTLLNMQQGVMIPNDWETELKDIPFDGFFETAGGYMPWFAQFKGGNGYIAICTTPWNAGYQAEHPQNGPYTHVSVRFEPSLGRMDYRRIVRYTLIEDPDKMKIVAIADIDPEKVKLTAEEYDVPMSHCYESAEDMLKEEKLADVMIIATQDRQHVGQAIKALKKGYHLLLEKPISPDLGECRKISEVAKECKREVVVCHVLRYTPIYQKVKEILDAGTIGDVISIMAIENVGWFHQAHSFVRGNWANSDETSPMILQKCCHDMDLYLWLAEKTCRSLTSYGDLNYFTPEHAPEGCTGRCLEGCKAKEKCIFDAEKIYLEHERIGYRQGNRGWPLDVLVPSGPTEEKLIEALKTGPYGKCVFHCNNNVVDHQVVNLNMTDGTTMSFTMCGFTAETSRYAKFMGTRGEVIVDMQPDEKESKIVIEYFDPGRTKEVIDVAALSDDFSGHGGGDNKMVEEFLDIISGEKTESTYITSLDRSLQSHYCALAAEYSRLHDGKAVEIDTFR